MFKFSINPLLHQCKKKTDHIISTDEKLYKIQHSFMKNKQTNKKLTTDEQNLDEGIPQLYEEYIPKKS